MDFNLALCHCFINANATLKALFASLSAIGDTAIFKMIHAHSMDFNLALCHCFINANATLKALFASLSAIGDTAIFKNISRNFPDEALFVHNGKFNFFTKIPSNFLHTLVKLIVLTQPLS